jgi:acyl dehydratase
MTGGPSYMDELKALIGTKTAAVVNHVEEGAIRRYAEAVGNPNPLHSNVEHARNSRYRGIISPPGFFGWPTNVSSGAVEMMSRVFAVLIQAGLLRILDGGVEYDFFLPVRAGDALAWYARFAGAVEREGKSGKMAFLTFEMTYFNENGDTVARARQTFLAR